MNGRRLLLALLLAILAAPARADVHPNVAPGFPVDQSFHVGDIDSVNLFNGALTLTIPIGGSYPVDGGFSYSLKLVYNSTPWQFNSVDYSLPGEPKSRVQALPSQCSNAGLGWRVSFGRFNPPCQSSFNGVQESLGPDYQDENGTDHLFYPTLHPGDAEDVLPSGVSDVQYTRDGSYLRMKAHPDGTRDVEFPDGSVRMFNAAGLPTKIKDAFGNFLSIDYNTTNQWVLTDSQGRTQRIYFRTDLPSYAQTIDRIELMAFGTSGNIPNKATYQFNYTVQEIGRACPNNDTDTPGFGVGSTVSVPLLTSVTLPDGSSWSAAVSDYVTTIPSGPSWPQNACADHTGNLTRLTLPTLGQIAWTWQYTLFRTDLTPKQYLQTTSAVATRTQTDPSRSPAVTGTWTYTFAPGIPAMNPERTATVIDPLGHKTINYFSVAIDHSTTGWSIYDYSLPFTRNYPLDAGGGATLNLSRQVYDASGALLRSEYVLYERDPAYTVSAPYTNTNRRVLRSRTVYEDDLVSGSTKYYGGVINSDFDGLGHYRVQQTEGNFPGTNTHTHTANFNPGQGTYVVDPVANTGSGFTPFPASSTWVTEAPTFLSDSEGAIARVDLCYQDGTATVIRKRVHRGDGATNGANDLVSTYDLSAQGNVTAEKSYGGDGPQQTIGSGTLCGTLSLPTSPEIEIDHTYSAGVRATSQYTGVTFNSLEQMIDANTGLPSSSKDTAGLQTNYEYDALGRLTWSEPQGTGNGGWTEYVYTPASGSIKANVIVRRRANGSKSATVLALNQIVFDGLGRVYQEFKNLPPDGTSSARRDTVYDAAGNKSKVSEWSTGAPGNFTQYLNFDPFGRPSTIRPPDGSSHDVTITYKGVRQVDRKVKIATAAGSETASTTTEIYDRQGRLYSVTEPSGSGGANVTTTYGYDMGNRLTSVSTTASSVTQTRGFTYDRAGLLTSETHPEKGASGGGSVSYQKYDSRGHALRKIDGPHDLTFTYDTAERLTQVSEYGTNGNDGRLLKVFKYSPDNGTNDWRLGKLQLATRYNYETVLGGPIIVQVDETYTYSGRDGRVSQRDTKVIPTVGGKVQPFHSFTQGFTYNDLGLVSSLSYPLCTHAGCTQSAPAVFADVPAGASNQKEIEAIYFAGITSGCQSSPQLLYCPSAAVTRAQMAVFLLAAKGIAPPPCTTPIFADVPCSSSYAPYVNELSREGVTSGCDNNPLRYCPDNPVTNAQMAVFLIQMLGISPAACAQLYTDVPCSYWAASWIAEETRRQWTSGCGGGNFCPDSVITRSSMASLIARAFDIRVQTDPNTQRTANFTYTQGLLTGVTSGATTYGTLSYYPNLLVSQVSHGNGITEMQTNDLNEMRRPRSLSASGSYASWSSDNYGYDGAGNIKAVGTATFTYDAVSRLVAASLYDGPTGAGNLKQQSYSFDAFGNLTAISGANGRNTPTSPQTNRLNGTGTVYDAAGNLTNWNSAVYSYDDFNQMTHMTSGAQDWVYLYTGDDERIWMYNIPANSSRWTLRDLGGKVLREYVSTGRWSVGTDYLYRDGLLLAAETQIGQRHFHLDHLGTPRLITRGSGYPAAYHVYYPFGEEATAFNQDSERMKLTGHERDLASPTGAGDDLDYMHARHESPVTGRFLSTDSHLLYGPLKAPQIWNRYSYSSGNPLKFLDPDGKEIKIAAEGNSAYVKSLLIESARRPTGRAVFSRFADAKDFSLVLKEGPLPGNDKARQAILRGDKAAVRFGWTLPKGSVMSGATVNTGAVITIDSKSIVEFSHDRTGLTTLNHESYHAMGIAGQFDPSVVQRGDQPTNETGPAEAFGRLVAQEVPDLSMEDARQLVEKWLGSVSTTTSQAPSSPPPQ